MNGYIHMKLGIEMRQSAEASGPVSRIQLRIDQHNLRTVDRSVTRSEAPFSRPSSSKYQAHHVDTYLDAMMWIQRSQGKRTGEASQVRYARLIRQALERANCYLQTTT